MCIRDRPFRLARAEGIARIVDQVMTDDDAAYALGQKMTASFLDRIVGIYLARGTMKDIFGSLAKPL